MLTPQAPEDQPRLLDPRIISSSHFDIAPVRLISADVGNIGRATVDVPARFKNSKAVGAVLGLTPSKYQSGRLPPRMIKELEHFFEAANALEDKSLQFLGWRDPAKAVPAIKKYAR